MNDEIQINKNKTVSNAELKKIIDEFASQIYTTHIDNDKIKELFSINND